MAVADRQFKIYGLAEGPDTGEPLRDTHRLYASISRRDSPLRAS